ncbi:MAG TPA: hypothetical protein VIY27_03235, partial [Myxococcota bacterium]
MPNADRRESGSAGAVVRRTAFALGLALLGASSAGAGDAALPLAAVEQLFYEARALRDAIDVTRSRGAAETTAGIPLAELALRYNGQRALLESALAAVAAPPLSETDRQALQRMRVVLEGELVVEKPAAAAEEPAASAEAAVECHYDAP